MILMKNKIRALFDKVFTRYVSTGFVFALDVLQSFVSALIVFFSLQYLVSNSYSSSPIEYWNRFLWVWLVTTTVSAALMFWLFKSYRIIIRHSSLSDIFRLGVAVLCASLLDAVVLVVAGLWHPTTWLILFAYFVLCVFLIVISRVIMVRTYEEMIRRFHTRDNERMPVLIYNTSDKAIALESRLQNSKHYKVIGFLTPDSSENKLSTHRTPVFYFATKEDVEHIVNGRGIKAIIFPTEKETRNESNRLVSYATELRLKLLVAPTIDEYANLATQGVRNVKVEDLLGREEIAISMDKIKERFAGKVVMVTGASGSIGSELCRQLARIGIKKLILFDNAETPMHNLRLELEDKYKDLNFVPVIGDVRQLPRLDYVFRTWHPQVVFHAAAYKHVPFMEENAYEAVYVNVFGTKLVADLAAEYGVEKFVMISTDKAVNPTNVMGATKRIAEIYTQSRMGNTKFITTRFGNVLGSNGSVVPLFRKQIAQGGPITVTDRRITRFFMTIPEACSLVLEAGSIGEGGDIFVFDMGEKIKIWDLAEKMRKLAHRPDIEIVETGLRPGEKLYEEVLANEENTIKTDNEKIMHAVVRKYETVDVDNMIEKLHTELDTCDPMKIVAQMKVIVPEFKSNNSVISQLDKA